MTVDVGPAATVLLPPDVFYLIFQSGVLSLTDLMSARRVCKSWVELVDGAMLKVETVAAAEGVSTESLIQLVQRMPAISSLDLSENASIQLDLTPLVSLRSLCHINLSLNPKCKLGPMSVQRYRKIFNARLETLSGMLEATETLETLTMQHNKLTVSAVQALDVVPPIRTLQRLDLSFNHLGNAGCRELLDCLPRSAPGLTALVLDSNSINNSGTDAIAALIAKSPPPLKILSLGCNNITNVGACALATALTKTTSLVTLNLAENQIGDLGVHALASIIEHSPVSSLRLSKNAITDIDLLARKISDQNNGCALRHLDLSDNILDSKNAAKQLGLALVDCSLESLNLANNPLGGGIEHVCEGLASAGCGLKALDVSACGLGIRGAEKVAAALACNTVLESLSLESNAIEAYGADLLAGGLADNDSLTSLSLDKNRLGHRGLIKLMEVLQSKPSLRSLSLSNNYIGPGGAKHIEGLMRRNSSVESINLSGNRLARKAPTLRRLSREHKSLSQLSLEDGEAG